MLNEAMHFADGDVPGIAFRLGLAAVAGMLLGLDRELKGVPAGLRTHGLIALSAAVITVSALLLYDQMGASESRLDPLRVIEGMATAAGIIAAGLIFVKGGTVKNLTSAAHVWLTMTVGIACGAGQYPLVAIGGGIALVLLVVVGFIERRVFPDEDGK